MKLFYQGATAIYTYVVLDYLNYNAIHFIPIIPLYGMLSIQNTIKRKQVKYLNDIDTNIIQHLLVTSFNKHIHKQDCFPSFQDQDQFDEKYLLNQRKHVTGQCNIHLIII